MRISLTSREGRAGQVRLRYNPHTVPAGHCVRLAPRDADQSKERGEGRVGTVRLRCDIAFRSTVDEVHTRFCYTVFDLRHCT